MFLSTKHKPSLPEVFYNRCFLKKFQKTHRKFTEKVPAIQCTPFQRRRSVVCSFTKKNTPLQVFSVEIFQNTCEPLLLKKCDALHDFIPFTQFKKREKHPQTCATSIKFAGFSLQTSSMGAFKTFQFAQMIPNPAKCLLLNSEF